MNGKDFLDELQLAFPIALQQAGLNWHSTPSVFPSFLRELERLAAEKRFADAEMDLDTLIAAYNKDRTPECSAPKAWVKRVEDALKAWGPEHEIAASNVSVPKVVDKELRHGETRKQEICVQWFGKARRGIPPNAQFFFAVLVKRESIYNDPAAFRVAFLGEVGEWPVVEGRKQMVEMVGKGNPTTTIVWLVSAEYTAPHPTHFEVPTSIVVPVALLGDGNCGVIYPVMFADMNVLAEENAKAEGRLSLGERLIIHPDMELPAEEIPWRENWEREAECLSCRQLEHSHDGNPGVPRRGSCNDLIHLCEHCGRRWWQFNTHFHLWKQVTDRREWDVVRHQAAIMEAGLEEAFEQ